MDLKTILKTVTEQFREAGIPEPETDAWYLLEYVTGISRAAYLMNPDQKLEKKHQEQYLTLAEKRKQRIPLQHLTGVQEFMGYEFLVNNSVLIPRQDTEILVEEAAKLLHGNMKILDLCTGSGCILISLLKIAEEKGLRKIMGTGTDLSKQALVTARENADRLLAKENSMEAEFLEGNLWEALEERFLEKEEREEQKFGMILSNPPYIRTEEIEMLQKEVCLYDPRMALDGGEDGLYFYREIAGKAPEYLKDGGSLLFEIGYDQGEAVEQILKASGFSEIKIKKDLAGLDRVVSGVYDKKQCNLH